MLYNRSKVEMFSALFKKSAYELSYLYYRRDKMSKIIKMLPYLLTCILVFYVIPLIITGEGIILVLVFVFPIISFIVSLVYGILNKFKPFQLLFPIFIGIIFIPAVFIFFSYRAWIFIAAYIVIALFGNMIGYVIARFSKRPE